MGANILRGVWLPALGAWLMLGAAAEGAEWQVRPGGSIAQTVRQARAGDTIVIARGDYQEHLLIDKPLTLRGHDRPTLSGNDQGDVIRVTAPDVTIETLGIALAYCADMASSRVAPLDSGGR